MFLFAAPDYSREAWTKVKGTLGLDFPNVRTAVEKKMDMEKCALTHTHMHARRQAGTQARRHAEKEQMTAGVRFCMDSLNNLNINVKINIKINNDN